MAVGIARLHLDEADDLFFGEDWCAVGVGVPGDDVSECVEGAFFDVEGDDGFAAVGAGGDEAAGPCVEVAAVLVETGQRSLVGPEDVVVEGARAEDVGLEGFDLAPEQAGPE